MIQFDKGMQKGNMHLNAKGILHQASLILVLYLDKNRGRPVVGVGILDGYNEYLGKIYRLNFKTSIPLV